jgi:hypothetical protein
MEVAACCVSTAPLGANKKLLPIDENPSRHCNELSGGFRSGEAEEKGQSGIFRCNFCGLLENQHRENASHDFSATIFSFTKTITCVLTMTPHLKNIGRRL